MFRVFLIRRRFLICIIIIVRLIMISRHRIIMLVMCLVFVSYYAY